jgi:hypothetical protein
MGRGRENWGAKAREGEEKWENNTPPHFHRSLSLALFLSPSLEIAYLEITNVK